jgi:predicted dienelactone hydrolase
LCQALKQADVISTSSFVPPVSAWVSDPRIKAIVTAAPAFGFAFDRVGLKDVHVPVQIWRAKDDRHQRNPYYDENVRAALPPVTEFQLVPGAGHYDFLAPCSPTLAMRVPTICIERNGFDRAKFHAMFNAEIVRFFKVNLP